MVARTLAELRQEYKPYDTLPSRIDHKASHETSKKPSFYRGLQLLHDAESIGLDPQCNVALAQQCLNFLPDPHGHSSFRPTLGASRRKVAAEPRRRAPTTRSASK